MPKPGCSATLAHDLHDDLLIYFYPVSLLNRFEARARRTRATDQENLRAK